MTRVKICGITDLDDALAAVAAGADALGFVFHPPSPRNISVENAKNIISKLPPFVQSVALFVNTPIEDINQIVTECRVDIVQLHGDESADYCRYMKHRFIKAFRVKDASILDNLYHYNAAGYLLDAYSADSFGGSGEKFDWNIAAEAAKRYSNIILAGGLSCENVAEGIRVVKPFAVDVSSGVEYAKGKKDRKKIELFIKNAKGVSI